MLLVIFSCKDEVINTQPASTTGNIVFWTPNLAAHGGFVNVTINGTTRQIMVNYPSQPTNCLSNNGCAFFNLEKGTYNYATVDYFGFTSKGMITVVENNCSKQRIE